MTAWDLETDADGTVKASYITPPPPTNQRGSTATLNFRFDATADYETVRDYLEFAGTASTGTTIEGVPYYRELHTGPSLAMGISPTSTMPATPGFWGLLVGGTEDPRLPPAILRLELEFLYLAPYADHADLADVKSTYEQ